MSDESGNVGTYTEIDIVKDTIKKANSVNLLEVLKKYNLNLDSYNRKICCPFSFHKMGRETTASFYYYPDSNSFYCFGCKSSGSTVDFVSLYENITKYKAALALIEGYEADVNLQNSESSGIEDQRLHLEFSHLIREFITLNKDNYEALEYSEKLSAAFDEINSKYNLDPGGLKLLIKKLKLKIELFSK